MEPVETQDFTHQQSIFTTCTWGITGYQLKTFTVAEYPIFRNYSEVFTTVNTVHTDSYNS